MKHYKAQISLCTEQFAKDGEGTDPDTFFDHGVVETIESETLRGLKREIERRYFNLSNPIGADVVLFDGVLEICYEDDFKPQINTNRIVISKIEESYIDIATEPVFKNITGSKS